MRSAIWVGMLLSNASRSEVNLMTAMNRVIEMRRRTSWDVGSDKSNPFMMLFLSEMKRCNHEMLDLLTIRPTGVVSKKLRGACIVA